MRDIAEITKRSHDTGFEQGSTVTLQTVMAWLDAHGGGAFADGISSASNDGSLELFRPGVAAATVIQTEISPPKMTRDQAASAGFTGNSCVSCGSLMMVRNGTCEKCNSCGATTGCS